MASSPAFDHPLTGDALLAAIVGGIPDAVLVTDRERQVVLANPAVGRVFGHSPDALQGRSTRILYADEAEFRRVGDAYLRADAAAPGQAYEALYRRHDGETFPGEAVSSIVRGDDGAALGCLAIVRDVSARHREQATLADMRRRLEDALEALDEGFSLWDADDRLVTCNSRYRELYPVSAPLMVPGADFESLVREALANGEFDVPPARREDWLRERVRRHREPPEDAFEQQHADRRWILVKERPTRDGGVAGIRVDITAQKRTELALRTLAAIGSDPALDLDGRFARLLALGSEHFGLPRAMIAVRDGETLRVRYAIGDGPGPAPGTAFDPTGTLCARILADGVLDAGSAAAANARPVPLTRTLAVRACVGAAFDLGGGATAVVAFFSDTPRDAPLADGDRELLRLLAQWASHELARDDAIRALDQARCDLERLATTDELTGLLNRRAVLEAGRAEFERSRRYGHALCVLALDVDFFKHVNDTLGHAAGDAVLQAVAKCCSQGVRSVDFVGRIGGEEFVVILVQTAQAQGMEVGERIRLGIAALAPGRDVTVSASIGVAERRNEDGDFEGLLARADAALYWAKERGRNRVCLAPG